MPGHAQHYTSSTDGRVLASAGSQGSCVVLGHESFRRRLQADDPLRSATRVDTVASYGQLRTVISVATDASADPLAADTDGMTSIDLDQPAAGSAGAHGRSPGDAGDPSVVPPGSSNRRASLAFQPAAPSSVCMSWVCGRWP